MNQDTDHIQNIFKHQSEALSTFMAIPEVQGVAIIVDIKDEGLLTVGTGTTQTARTLEKMKDDAIDMICKKHCCAEQPFTKTCENCPLYQFIQYQEGA